MATHHNLTEEDFRNMDAIEEMMSSNKISGVEEDFEDDDTLLNSYLDATQRDFCGCCFPGGTCSKPQSADLVHKEEYDSFMQQFAVDDKPAEQTENHSSAIPIVAPKPTHNSSKSEASSFDEPAPYCMHGYDCREPVCHFNHPSKRNCRDGGACQIANCSFNHPAAWIREREASRPRKVDTPPTTHLPPYIREQRNLPQPFQLYSQYYQYYPCQNGRDCPDKLHGCFNNHPDIGDCRHGPSCTRQDCKFNHPPEWIETAYYMQQQQQDCRHGPSCTRQDCKFHHPPPPQPWIDPAYYMQQQQQDCRRGPSCTRQDCKFHHPPPPPPWIDTGYYMQQPQQDFHYDLAYDMPFYGVTNQYQKDIPCKNGEHCVENPCRFNHPNTPDCMYGAQCHNRQYCRFNHPG